MSLYRQHRYFMMAVGVILSVVIIKWGLFGGIKKFQKETATRSSRMWGIFYAAIHDQWLVMIWLAFLVTGVLLPNSKLHFYEGTLEKAVFVSSLTGGDSKYDLILKKEGDNSTPITIEDVHIGEKTVAEKLKKGDRVELCSIVGSSTFISKINGAESGEYKYQYKEHNRNPFKEKVLVSVIIVFQIGIQFVWYRLEKRKKFAGNRKIFARLWKYGCVIYGVVMELSIIDVISYKLWAGISIVPYHKQSLTLCYWI